MELFNNNCTTENEGSGQQFRAIKNHPSQQEANNRKHAFGNMIVRQPSLFGKTASMS
jgi:hypothetical protein